MINRSAEILKLKKKAIKGIVLDKNLIKDAVLNLKKISD